MTNSVRWWSDFFQGIYASLCFYTCLPLPYLPDLEFRYVSRYAPLVGLLIGSLVALLDFTLVFLGIPVLTRNGLVICAWLLITGGLHLDGAMDTADGLAVTDPKRRLEVMADSATGAFGAMVAIAIILLKTLALTEISDHRGFILMAVCGWGRWGQVVAILRYPYLKPTGKGAFHKQSITSPWLVLPSIFMLICFSIIHYILNPTTPIISGGIIIIGMAIAIITPAWFNQRLGGHTGDTYGAVVEWTETLMLCALTIV